MREANDRGFDCLLVEDATAAGEEGLWRWAVESVKGEGGIFGTVGRVGDVVEGVERKARLRVGGNLEGAVGVDVDVERREGGVRYEDLPG